MCSSCIRWLRLQLCALARIQREYLDSGVMRSGLYVFFVGGSADPCGGGNLLLVCLFVKFRQGILRQAAVLAV